MLASKPTLISVALAIVHYVSHAAATAVADAEAALITPAPTPTVEDLEARQVAGGPGTPILSTLHYAFTDLPEQVYPFQVLRGPQFGINKCNSTTGGPTSVCQTLLFNGPDDFCLWGSPDPNGQIGNVEAKVVSYCTKDKWGTRVFPAGAITGLQWIKTSAYIQVSGFIDNTALSLDPNDTGGELDPHGADLQGNPLGGVVYSTSFDPAGQTPQQVFNWNTFVGSGQFCFKACFNNVTSPDYCENRFDLVGCEANMPSAVQNGTFTECDGDLQDVIGTFTTNGVVSTLSPGIQSIPYSIRTPSSSNCVTFSSEQLFSGAASATTTGTASGTAATATGGVSSSSPTAGVPSSATVTNTGVTTQATGATGGAGTGTNSASGSGASQTGKSGAASLQSVSRAGVMVAVVGAVFAVLM